MDASTATEIKQGKRASVPKHGKKPENRLWSKWRRGHGTKTDDNDGTINPDATIRVAAVCGEEVLIYDKSKRVRRLSTTYQLANHGAAVLFAAEWDEAERRSRSSSRDDFVRVSAPFYQVKVAGHVIDHTNLRDRAHVELRDGAAKPKQLWRISEGGGAELLEMVA
jgi:hypothetical protein